MPRESLSKVGGLGADEQVVLVQDFLLGELGILVGVRLEQQVLGLSLGVVKVGGNDPRLNLKQTKKFGLDYYYF